ncbi:hypothetical protein Ais01nite_32080 [Asanoa ishikariensis]|nr:hypothetical protein Ais01nite_32080 [Asanoa ishikariensis]
MAPAAAVRAAAVLADHPAAAQEADTTRPKRPHRKLKGPPALSGGPFAVALSRGSAWRAGQARVRAESAQVPAPWPLLACGKRPGTGVVAAHRMRKRPSTRAGAAHRVQKAARYRRRGRPSRAESSPASVSWPVFGRGKRPGTGVVAAHRVRPDAM